MIADDLEMRMNRVELLIKQTVDLVSAYDDAAKAVLAAWEPLPHLSGDLAAAIQQLGRVYRREGISQ